MAEIMIELLKKIVSLALAPAGLELRRSGGPGFNSEYLSRFGEYKTVFDVGVADGTPELYKAFPRAAFVLVDPHSDFSRARSLIGDKADVRVFSAAAGAGPGTAELNVESDPALSSVKSRPRSDASAYRKQVPVTTLDDICGRLGRVSPPVLVKIDVEGAELDVLKGAGTLLKTVDALIVEVSISRRFIDGPDFVDVAVYLRERGFRVRDILTVCRGPNGANLADVLFTREPQKDD